MFFLLHPAFFETHKTQSDDDLKDFEDHQRNDWIPDANLNGWLCWR